MFLKKMILILIVATSSKIYANCYDTALTNEAMQRCAYSLLEEKDKELSKLYDKLIKDHPNDAEYLKNVKEAKKTFKKFRELYAKIIYPTGGYQVHQMCVYSTEKELTEVHIDFLKSTMKYIEGDACAYYPEN